MSTPHPITLAKDGLILKKLSPPLNIKAFKLIAFDMDSTLINIECIDEIASAVGLKDEVARITALTMSGEIKDFKESLKQRVALLKGTPQNALKEVYENRLKLNPGADRLVSVCREAGLQSLLVSGGFTYFADRVKSMLQIDFTRSNELEIKNGYLTGDLIPQDWGVICDGEEKRRMLIQTCKNLGISLEQTITVGDGSNDIPMMLECSNAGGLSVAYHAKPLVREQALLSIESGGLDRMLEIFKI